MEPAIAQGTKRSVVAAAAESTVRRDGCSQVDIKPPDLDIAPTPNSPTEMALHGGLTGASIARCSLLQDAQSGRRDASEFRPILGEADAEQRLRRALMAGG